MIFASLVKRRDLRSGLHIADHTPLNGGLSKPEHSGHSSGFAASHTTSKVQNKSVYERKGKGG